MGERGGGGGAELEEGEELVKLWVPRAVGGAGNGVCCLLIRLSQFQVYLQCCWERWEMRAPFDVVSVVDVLVLPGARCCVPPPRVQVAANLTPNLLVAGECVL